MSGLVQQPTFDVVWIHPRGTSLHQIVTDSSPQQQPAAEGGKKVPKLFTQRPATLSSVLTHVKANKMVRCRSDISYWVGSGVDVFFYPPPSTFVGSDDTTIVTEKKVLAPNIATDALVVKLSLDDYSISSFPIQPHGLCLCVASGVIPSDSAVAPIPKSLSVETVLKVLTFTGQLGTVQGDKQKMLTCKHHWKW
jgi:hypothetical protein